MKAADSLIIFRLDQWCTRHGLSKQNAPSTGEKFLLRNARFRKWGQMENSWPNHKINGNSGSPKLLIQANDGQIRSWYIGFAPFGDVLLSGKVTETIVIYTRVSTLNWNSDTVVALSPSKRVYAILWKMNTCLVLSLSKRAYTLWKETECTAKIVQASHAVLSSSKEVYTHFGLHVVDDEAEDPP